MASLSYPAGLQGRPGRRPGLSREPIGSQDLRNPDRIDLFPVDLRGSGSYPVPARIPGNGPVLHGEILGPSGRPLDSQASRAVGNAIRGITIEGELGRGDGPRARRLRDILKKMLGAAHPLLKGLGLLGSGLFEDFATILNSVAAHWEHPNGDLEVTCAPSARPWVGEVMTGEFQTSCTTIRRFVGVSPYTYPDVSTGYPIADFGSSATATGYMFWRYSAIQSFGGSPVRYYQMAAGYRTIDATQPLGPVWVPEQVAVRGALRHFDANVMGHERQQLGPGRKPRPVVSGLPYMPPYSIPAVQVGGDVKPDRDTPRRPPRPPLPPVVVIHDRLPPGKGVKERKTKVPPGLIRAVSKVTEACEIVDVAYASLPAKLTRWKGRDGRWRNQHITCHQKALFVYLNALSMDMEKFLIGLAKNEVEDRVIGKLSQARGPDGRGLDVSRMPDVFPW